MKKILFTAILAFAFLFSNAQVQSNRFTIELNGGASLPSNIEYWGDNYAIGGPSAALKFFYNNKKKLSFGLEINFTSHSFYAQGFADDLLKYNSRNFNLTPRSTYVTADPYLHLLTLGCIKYNQPIGNKFVLDFGTGLGVNSFATPVINYSIRFNDPDNLNYSSVTSIHDSYGYAFAFKVDAGIAYNFGQRWATRLGFQYINSSYMSYVTTVYSTEFDDLVRYDQLTSDVGIEFPASWMNFTLGVSYSFGNRE